MHLHPYQGFRWRGRGRDSSASFRVWSQRVTGVLASGLLGLEKAEQSSPSAPREDECLEFSLSKDLFHISGLENCKITLILTTSSVAICSSYNRKPTDPTLRSPSKVPQSFLCLCCGDFFEWVILPLDKVSPFRHDWWSLLNSVEFMQSMVPHDGTCSDFAPLPQEHIHVPDHACMSSLLGYLFYYVQLISVHLLINGYHFHL